MIEGIRRERAKEAILFCLPKKSIDGKFQMGLSSLSGFIGHEDFSINAFADWKEGKGL